MCCLAPLQCSLARVAAGQRSPETPAVDRRCNFSSSPTLIRGTCHHHDPRTRSPLHHQAYDHQHAVNDTVVRNHEPLFTITSDDETPRRRDAETTRRRTQPCTTTRPAGTSRRPRLSAPRFPVICAPACCLSRAATTTTTTTTTKNCPGRIPARPRSKMPFPVMTTPTVYFYTNLVRTPSRACGGLVHQPGCNDGPDVIASPASLWSPTREPEPLPVLFLDCSVTLWTSQPRPDKSPTPSRFIVCHAQCCVPTRHYPQPARRC